MIRTGVSAAKGYATQGDDSGLTTWNHGFSVKPSEVKNKIGQQRVQGECFLTSTFIRVRATIKTRA